MSEIKALIEGLNKDLAGEYQAVIMYTNYAACVSGVNRKGLKEFFAAEVPDELRHAQFLADKISALGGLPVTAPEAVTLPQANRAMLEEVLKAEKTTIARYVERRAQAEAFGDYALVAELEDILADETRHREETEKLLRSPGED